ncbi:RCC1 domain-containing protein, partial [Streptomyces sp. NPDC002730]|uniref:RCC1 domain-containing protein n=1 Tax=Streptomyces sp. NPDC002730 TaxID=3364662 RepID=UPI00368B5E5E
MKIPVSVPPRRAGTPAPAILLALLFSLVASVLATPLAFGGSRAPRAAAPLTGVTAIAAGDSHTLALMKNGTVKAWGMNTNGQIGDGTNKERLSPVTVPGLTGVKAISAHGHHSMALLSDGTVRAWGWNDFGQLCD